MEEKELVKIDKENFNPILTRAGDVNALTFKTIDKKILKEINDWMPVVNNKVSCFNKKNSQTTFSLMTLNMIDAAPYRILRQILAQVERKRAALKESMFRIEKKKITYKKLQNKEELTEIEELNMKKMAIDIIDSQGPIEAALKELGLLKRQYEDIRKNNNIPENWDEQDFEEEEIKHHIISMFRNGLRDRLQGVANQGSMEYFSQFGINSITAYALIDNYIMQIRKIMDEGKLVDIETEYEFFDKMYVLFKDEYKKAMKRLGLTTIKHNDFLMKNHD